MATHQGPTQVIEQLLGYAEPNAEHIIKHIKKDIVLCYSGMSGTALATAVFIELHRRKFQYKVGMIFVRKEDEPSNSGNKLHHHQGALTDAAFVFVDDQISNKARTLARVEKGIQDLMPTRIFYGYSNEEHDAAIKKWKAVKMDYALLSCGLWKFIPVDATHKAFASSMIPPCTRALVDVNNPDHCYRW